MIQDSAIRTMAEQY